MKPRLAGSKKWTNFPIELTVQIQGIFQENFEKTLGEGKYIIEGRIYAEEILFRIGFSPAGRLFQANFEASTSYTELDHVQATIDLCMDSTASMMEEYYNANERLDLPRNWSEFIFEDKKVYLQFSSNNTEIESLADKLLGEAEDGLVREEALTEEALSAEALSSENSSL